jgi:hypothetical protein
MKSKIIFLAAKFSVLGTLVVIVLFLLAAFGKMKRGSAFTSMYWFAGAGGAIPLIMLSIWGLVRSNLSLRAETLWQVLFLTLWPVSFALIGLDGTSSALRQTLFVGILVMMNAGLYGIVGLCIGYAWRKLRGAE